jgi:hypothetical protein
MSDYIVITDYAAKDAMLTGNPSKLVKGTEIGADFDAVAVAVATKFDSTDLGVTVQPYDADLTTWAGVTPGTGVATALAVNVGSAGAPVINGGALGTPSSGTLTNATGLPAAGVTGTALVSAAIGTTVVGIAGSNMTGGINSARGNITQHATTMDFFAVTSPDILDGTGSAVTITACVNAPQAGATRKFYPIVATVLTHGATFDIAGNANLTAAAGDCWIIEAKTASTYRVTAVKEDGLAVTPGVPVGTSTTTLVLADAGKHQYYTGTAGVTIPTNASVPFPVGTAITFVMDHASQALTFTTTSLTVYKAGTATAWASGGTLSGRGLCTFLKVATDTWYVTGTGLS